MFKPNLNKNNFRSIYFLRKYFINMVVFEWSLKITLKTLLKDQNYLQIKNNNANKILNKGI